MATFNPNLGKTPPVKELDQNEQAQQDYWEAFPMKIAKDPELQPVEEKKEVKYKYAEVKVSLFGFLFTIIMCCISGFVFAYIWLTYVWHLN